MEGFLSDPVVIGAGIALGAVVLVLLWRGFGSPLRHARLAGVELDLGQVVGMRLRGTPPRLVVDAAEALSKRGQAVDLFMIEAIYLAYRQQPLTGGTLADLVEKEAQQKERR